MSDQQWFLNLADKCFLQRMENLSAASQIPKLWRLAKLNEPSELESDLRNTVEWGGRSGLLISMLEKPSLSHLTSLITLMS